MSDRLSFDASWEAPFQGDALEAATHANLQISLGDEVLTNLIDHTARTTSSSVRVSAYPLALWLACNWWRLRWESKAARSDWCQAHALGAAGHGYTWPDVTISSLGDFIEIDARPTRGGPWEPVRFLGQARGFVSPDEFAAGAASFVETVLARLDATGHRDTPLSRTWHELQTERRDPQLALVRRFEASLGFDPEASPDGLVDAAIAAATEFGTEAVAEWVGALAHSGRPPDWGVIAADLLAAPVATVPDTASLRHAARQAAAGLSSPWQRGEAAAVAVRSAMGRPHGPLSSTTLSSWLSMDSVQEASEGAAYTAAHRDSDQDDGIRVRVQGHHKMGQRFKLARLIADHLVSAASADRLLPATRAKTSRQSLQRAFAAELLLPWHDLSTRTPVEPEEDTMDAIAEEYEVSPLVVRMRLVDKGRLERDWSLGR